MFVIYKLVDSKYRKGMVKKMGRKTNFERMCSQIQTERTELNKAVAGICMLHGKIFGDPSAPPVRIVKTKTGYRRVT